MRLEALLLLKGMKEMVMCSHCLSAVDVLVRATLIPTWKS